jgi:predicted nuclease of predicted toxin-antitoxin system
VKLYLDESVSVAFAGVLRQHGVDCLTARDVGNLGADDESQLLFATQQTRVILTHDTRDFLGLASMWVTAGRSHAGILLVHQMALPALLLRFRAFQIRYQQAEFVNQVLWLPPPLEEK